MIYIIKLIIIIFYLLLIIMFIIIKIYNNCNIVISKRLKNASREHLTDDADIFPR